MFRYNILNNEVEIIGFDKETTELEIPAFIEGFPVTSIGESAFESTSVHYVQLPTSVVRIKPYAFRYSSLSSINLDHLKEIGDEAFRATKLVDIAIPDNVLLGNGVFHHCHRLHSVTLPNSISLNLDNHFAGLHVNEIHYCGTESQFYEKIIGRLECDHPVFYFLDNHGDEYKEVLGTGKTENLEYTVFGDGIRIDKATGRKIVIPERLEDNWVTSIGSAAFDKFTEEVFLPMTIRDCPDAFILCALLKKLSVPFDVFVDISTIPKITVIERRFS